MRNKIFLSLLFIIIAGCQPSNMRQEEVKAGDARDRKDTPFVYSPAGNLEISFKLSSSYHKNYGYSYFCKDERLTHCNLTLPYDKYAGRKGYVSLVKEDKFGGEKYYKITMKNGEILYYLLPKDSRIDSHIGPFDNESRILKAHESVGKKLSSRSMIKVVGVTRDDGLVIYVLSNGVKIPEEKFFAFQKILQSKKPQVADTLTRITKGIDFNLDKVENRVIIKSAGHKIYPLSAKLIVKNNRVTILGNVTYKGSDWIFVENYLVVAGTYRHKSGNVKVYRDNSSSTVWEWHAFYPNHLQLLMLRKVASSKETTVRFYGQKYYADKKMEESGRQDLEKILKIYDLLRVN